MSSQGYATSVEDMIFLSIVFAFVLFLSFLSIIFHTLELLTELQHSPFFLISTSAIWYAPKDQTHGIEKNLQVDITSNL